MKFIIFVRRIVVDWDKAERMGVVSKLSSEEHISYGQGQSHVTGAIYNQSVAQEYDDKNTLSISDSLIKLMGNNSINFIKNKIDISLYEKDIDSINYWSNLYIEVGKKLEIHKESISLGSINLITEI